MFTVQITYKSGKVENAEIAIADYTSAMTQLQKEGRLVSMKIIACS
jgi:hypothetical protein